jgi:hypothetical protein
MTAYAQTPCSKRHARALPACAFFSFQLPPAHLNLLHPTPHLYRTSVYSEGRCTINMVPVTNQPFRFMDLLGVSFITGEIFIESRCCLGNQTQQQPRGPQLWKGQLAGKQSI